MIRIKPYISYMPVTEFVVERELRSRGDSGIVFVVPESVKASVERVVFDDLIKDKSGAADAKTGFGAVCRASLDIDVLSFVRLSYHILSMAGKNVPADDSLLRNIIYRVLTDAPSDFKNLNKLRTHFEYVDLLVDLIGDFGRYGISSGDIRNLLSNSGEENARLSEVALLIERARDMGDRYGLPVNETLPELARALISEVMSDEKLSGSRRYRDLSNFLRSRFVIAGTGSVRNFTPQEIRLIKALSDYGGDVVVYASVKGESDDGAFSAFGRSTVESLRAIGASVEGDPEIFIPDRRSRLCITAGDYARGATEGSFAGEDDGTVNLVSYAMEDDAVSYVANEINRLVRVEGRYRFRDIRIFCADESYKETIKSIFGLFGLQMFIDRKVILMNTPVVRYVLGLLDLSVHGFELSYVLKLLRTGILTGARADLTDLFENYCLRENIRDGHRIFNENYYKLSYVTEAGEDEPEEADKEGFGIYDEGEFIPDGPGYLYEKVVKRILLPLRAVTEKIDGKETLSGKAAALGSHLGSLTAEIEALRDEFIDRGESDTALAVVKGYTEIMSLLGTLAGPVNDVVISREQFLSLLRTDMKNKASGSIPLSADSVEICTIETAIYTRCKVLFILGANAANFPHTPIREGIIPGKDLKALGLPDKASAKSRQEFIGSALLLGSAEDSLYFIHTASEIPSPVLNFLRFTNGNPGDHDSSVPTGTFVTPVYGQPVTRRHNAEDPESSFIKPERMKRLLAGREICSVTSIENYNSCHLKYMLDYALRIKVRTDGSRIEANELGSLCHSMFEYSMKDVKDELLSKDIDSIISEATPDKVKTLADRYFSEAVRENQITNPDKFTARYAVYPGLKVKRIFERAYPAFLGYFKASGYRPDGFEVKLDELDNKIEVKTTAEGIDFDFRFKGSIDRVDRDASGVLRIVDYKTGKKEISPEKAYEGVQIQLFAYAYGLALQPGNIVDNVGYVRTYLPTSRKASDKPFKYLDFDTGKYSLKAVADHAYGKLKEACADIAAGKGDAKLTASEFEGACHFCGFKGICGRLPNQPKPDKSRLNEQIAMWENPETKKGKKK